MTTVRMILPPCWSLSRLLGVAPERIAQAAAAPAVEAAAEPAEEAAPGREGMGFVHGGQAVRVHGHRPVAGPAGLLRWPEPG